jgi:hypothetical protein
MHLGLSDTHVDIYGWKDEEIMVLMDDDPASPLYPIRQTVVSIRSLNTHTKLKSFSWNICLSSYTTREGATSCLSTVSAYIDQKGVAEPVTLPVSGHGVQIEDLDGDEADGLDEG